MIYNSIFSIDKKNKIIIQTDESSLRLHIGNFEGVVLKSNEHSTILEKFSQTGDAINAFYYALEKIVEENYSIHPDIQGDLALLTGEIFQDVREEIPFRLIEGRPEWLGFTHQIWENPRKNTTWLYQKGNKIFLEVTPNYPWHSSDPKPGEKFYSFEEYKKSYKPIALFEVSRKTAERWYRKIKKIFETKYKNYEIESQRDQQRAQKPKKYIMTLKDPAVKFILRSTGRFNNADCGDWGSVALNIDNNNYMFDPHNRIISCYDELYDGLTRVIKSKDNLPANLHNIGLLAEQHAQSEDKYQDWDGQKYQLWKSNRYKNDTPFNLWLYRVQGEVILEVTPIYRNQPDNNYTFQDFERNYKPIARIALAPTTVQRWYKKLDKLNKVIAANHPKVCLADH